MARKTPFGIEKRFDRFGEWIGETRVMRKAYPLLRRYPKVQTVMTWLMRAAVGVTFTVSGLSKGIDPWGTYYKMTEYLQAMGIHVSEWGNTVLALSFALFSLEFFIGVSLLTGSFRKASPIMGSLVMAVMLPLTLWIAIADPVADCGCFGDFLVISNWATFIKNVFLSIGFVWLLKFNSKCGCLIAPYLQWLMTVASLAFIATVGYIGYWNQPLVDFRPFKTGTRLLAEDEDSEYEPVYTFVYERDGETKEIGEDDDIPDESEGWRFVRREENAFQQASSGKDDKGGEFRIWSEDGKHDLTPDLATDSRQLILMVSDINELSMAAGWKINALYDMAEKEDVEFFAVAAGSPSQIERWRDLTSGQYPIYTAEDTSIKELVRGNPALVATDKGLIVWKSALSALRIDDEGDLDVMKPIAGTDTDGVTLLAAFAAIFVSFLATLSLASFVRIKL